VEIFEGNYAVGRNILGQFLLGADAAAEIHGSEIGEVVAWPRGPEEIDERFDLEEGSLVLEGPQRRPRIE